ncbi:MAG TPA: class IV adenylate cyclase [Terriglobia bacterium]|nr:class IV adenylate cyclase [Terriglobia bacterium]
MKHVNYEFKARLRDENHVRAALKKQRARHIGNDHQIDTYFRVPRGRLKVREGRIENALIFYQRTDSPRPRRAQIEMMLLPRRNSMRSVLAASLGVLTAVDKRREIYLVGNVKIHLDRVRGLGKFIEVEAVSHSRGLKKIRAQARRFQKLLGIPSSDILANSYADMVLKKSRR